MKTEKSWRGVLVSGVILLIAAGVGIAQRQYMLASAGRPEVKVTLSGSRPLTRCA